MLVNNDGFCLLHIFVQKPEPMLAQNLMVQNVQSMNNLLVVVSLNEFVFSAFFLLAPGKFD